MDPREDSPLVTGKKVPRYSLHFPTPAFPGKAGVCPSLAGFPRESAYENRGIRAKMFEGSLGSLA